jgi:hypothetical protein
MHGYLDEGIESLEVRDLRNFLGEFAIADPSVGAV